MIIADPGVFGYVRERAPGIPLHVSTQANVVHLVGEILAESGCPAGRTGPGILFAELTQIRPGLP